MGGLFANIKSTVAEIGSGALGHGAVATYPDRPYLIWSFTYKSPEPMRVERNNPADFLEGCRALHETFRRFAERRLDLDAGDGRPFEEIEDTVAAIIAHQAPCDGRIEFWQRAAASGSLWPDSAPIPPYRGRETWHERFRRIDEGRDSESAALLKEPVFRFYQAAAAHRTWVLRDLLPAHGLVVG